MKRTNQMKRIFVTMLCISSIMFVNAQSVVVSAAYDAVGEGSVTASIGQVVFMTAMNGSGDISQGIQQGIVIEPITAIDDEKIQLTAYPNPAVDVLHVCFENEMQGDCKIVVYDNSGKMVFQGDIVEPCSDVQTICFKTGVYFVEVRRNEISLKQFKIIKN